MPTPGYVFKDSGTTPPANEDTLNSYMEEKPRDHSGYGTANEPCQNGPPSISTDTSYTAESRSTSANTTVGGLQAKSASIAEKVLKDLDPDGHDIARRSVEVGGAVQTHAGGTDYGETCDIGWHKSNDEIPDPLIGNLPNGQLFARIRRFNKDVFAVQSVPASQARGLDLKEAWSTEYSTDKLTLNLQRLYLNVVIGFASFGKQVARLRSWRETQRTGAFLAAYTLAWFFDVLVPVTIGTIIAISSSKEARDLLFPPAPLALVNIVSGGLQKPQAGQLGTQDTLSGAPEKQEGEAREEEAAKIVQNVRHIIQKTIGMHEEEQNAGDPLENKIPKPIRKAVANIKGAGTDAGHTRDEQGQTEGPMEEMIWAKANPEKLAPYIDIIPHVIGEIVDSWERFENVLSPTPPYSKFSYLRLDAVLLPIFLGSFFISSYMVYKGTGLIIGFLIFGNPVLAPSMEWLNRNYPNWMVLLEPKNNLLRGVPTHAQLTLTLLRIGEVNKTPLPPVPSSNKDDPQQNTAVDLDDIPLNVSDEDKLQAIDPSSMHKAHSHESGEPQDEPKHKRLSKIARVFKGQTKATVDAKLAVDKVLAAGGSSNAKGHLGVLPKTEKLVYAGPTDFKARYNGKPGWLHITSEVKPSLVFTTQEAMPVGDLVSKDVEFTIPVEDIKVLKRAAAFSNKLGKKAAEYSEDRELLGALEIDDLSGKTWRFTALPERNELFNRLVAMGRQRWENL